MMGGAGIYLFYLELPDFDEDDFDKFYKKMED
jgi:hypothetical protein